MRPSAVFVGDDMTCREANTRRDGRRSELDIALEVAGVTHLFGCYESPPEHLPARTGSDLTAAADSAFFKITLVFPPRSTRFRGARTRVPRRRDKRATRMEAAEELDHAGTAPGATGAKETAAGGGDSPMNENVGAGAMGTSVAEKEVAAPGSGGKSAGTPDLPQSEPRSLTADDDDDERSGAAGVTADARDDDAGAELRPSRSPDDAPVAPTTTTTTTPADPSSGDPSRSLADVLGKRPTPASDPKSSASAKPPAKKAARAKPSSGPGITSFLGGGGKGGSGSDEDAPSRMPTRAEKLAADEAEEAAAIAAALAASEADEEDRHVKAAAAEAAATAEAVQDHEPDPTAAVVSASEAKKTHPLLVAAQRKKEKAAAEARAKAEAEAEAKAEAEARAKAEAEARAKAEAEAIAKAEAEAKAKAEAEAAAVAKAEADARAKAEEEERRRAAEDAALLADGSCEICGVDDDDGLLCDGCDGVFHAKCVDLDSTPAGEWFCARCAEHGVTEAGGGVAQRRAAKRKKANDEKRMANPFFMTPDERRKAAETEAKQALKRDLEAVKQTDAALSTGKKVHHFFAMQKEKAAAAKESGASASSLNPLGLYVLPAPIERAMPPVHITPPIDPTVAEDEAVGRNALASVVGPPRARFNPSPDTTLDNIRRALLPPAAVDTDDKQEEEQEEEQEQEQQQQQEEEEEDPGGEESVDLEEAEDAYLTDAARYVLASKGRWNAGAIVSGELASTRGELRARLATLRARRGRDGSSSTDPGLDRSTTRIGPAAAAGALWTDAYAPAATDQLVCDGGAARGVGDWLAAWSSRIFAEEAGVAKPPKEKETAGNGGRKGKRRKKGRNAGSDDDTSDEECDEWDDETSRATYAPLVTKRGAPANGLLLCGPVGSGKTAAVYAAAEEFGFKVLEVNPSRKRSGLEVLSQFGEATQSRRIDGGDEQKKPAGGIGGFFGKKPAPAATKPAAKDAAEDAKETARNTLILFEEVDVLRGEDRGFMAALAQLIAGAKRPIVLTSNSPSLPSLIDAPLPAGTSGDGLMLARVRFRTPSPADAAVYASLVAAAEGRRVSPADVASAARFADAGDVRRALLSAQFAASSPAAEMTRRPTRARTTKSRSAAAGAALEYDTDAVAAVAAELIARVDPRVAAAEALAPARATRAMSLVAEGSELEEREAERRAEEAAVRRRAEVVADAAAAKAERAARNDARIEKGPAGNRRGSLGLVAAGQSANDGDEDGEEAERAAKVAAAADAARDAYLAEAAARFAERAPGGESPGGEAPETPPDAYPGDDWARALRELDSLASLSASLSAADAMLVPARATVTGPSNGAAERVDVGGWPGGAGAWGDGGDGGWFDPSDDAEERGGADLAGEPRHTIGGGGDVAREASARIERLAVDACLGDRLVDCRPPPRGGDDAIVVGGGSAPVAAGPASSVPKPAVSYGRVPAMGAAAARLRELAECTGATCARGYGCGLGATGEANERAFFLARIVRIQEESASGVGAEGGRRRRKKASQYLQVGADVARELAALGTFGVTA